jgi:hypothetical protein
MDEAERKIAEQNLIEADDAIAQGREDIAKQMQLIAELTREGYDIYTPRRAPRSVEARVGTRNVKHSHGPPMTLGDIQA